MKNFRHRGNRGHGGKGSRATQAGSVAALGVKQGQWQTEGDGDEHQVPPSRSKAGMIAWKSEAGFSHGSVLEAT